MQLGSVQTIPNMRQADCVRAGGSWTSTSPGGGGPPIDSGLCFIQSAPMQQVARQQAAPAPVYVTVSPQIQSQISPTISPVFQQQFQPSNSPQSASTQAAPVMAPSAPAPAYVPPAPTAPAPVYSGPIGPQPVQNLAPAVPEYVPPQPTALVLNPSSGGGGSTGPDYSLPTDTSQATTTTAAPAPSISPWLLLAGVGLLVMLSGGKSNAA